MGQNRCRCQDDVSLTAMGTSVRDFAGPPYMRFRRALDRGNVTETLSAASELEHVGLVEALEGNAAYALAELLSRLGLERPCETLVAWAQRV